MNDLFISGELSETLRPLDDRPEALVNYLVNPEHYHVTNDLIAALNVAIILGQPLLVTGEPGVGKTQLAYFLAWRLKLEPVLKCQVRSSTTFSQLFYEFDELARFRDCQNGRASRPLTHYLRFNALGKAILFAGGPNARLTPIPGSHFVDNGEEQRPVLFKDVLDESYFPDQVGKPSVVLIDELDKAPRDTPNDMLGELENMSFEIPELGVEIKLPERSKNSPIVIITSNSEKSLPDTFLRRCAYYNITFPDSAALKQIIYGRLPGLQKAPKLWIEEAIGLFQNLRSRDKGIRKPPGTAELLGCLKYLSVQYGVPDTSLKEQLSATTGDDNPLLTQILSILIKSKDDRDIAQQIASSWVKG